MQPHSARLGQGLNGGLIVAGGGEDFGRLLADVGAFGVGGAIFEGWQAGNVGERQFVHGRVFDPACGVSNPNSPVQPMVGKLFFTQT